MSERSLSEHLAHLEEMARYLKPGARVRVGRSGRTGTVVRRMAVARDGWMVRWDDPVFGCTESRVATPNLEKEDAR